MIDGGKKTSSAWPIIVLILLLVAGIGAAGWFGYSFYVKKQREKDASIAEVQRKAMVEKEVTALLKSAKDTFDENKHEEALNIVETALKKDPGSAEANIWYSEMSQAIALEHLLPVKKQAELQWAQAGALAPDQGFSATLKKTAGLFAEAEKLYARKDYKKAMASYQGVGDECDRLLALDVERQRAREIRDRSDKSRDLAEQSKAAEEAKQMWDDARAKEKEATTAFENGEFAKAMELWRDASNIFSSAGIFAAGTRAVRASEKRYTDLLDSVKPGLLDMFGGQKWTDTKALTEAGRKMAVDQKWNDAVATWGRASESLKVAVKTAVVEEARDKIRKEYLVALSSVRAVLAETAKVPKTDSSRISVLQDSISVLNKVKGDVNYALLTGDEHVGLDDMLTTLHREKFYFRFPDLELSESMAALSTADLASGSGEALVNQMKGISGMDALLAVKTRKTGITMRFIPAGEFMMGHAPAEDGSSDELPQHKVVIGRPFYMAAYEVTQEQWQKLGLSNPSHFAGDSSAPVESVTFDKATEFCNWLCEKEGVPRDTYRLPTEAEWEYACRAGTTQSFSSGLDGGDLARVGWYGVNSAKTTHPVGQKLPNAYGLYDMHGNVWEWCNDGERVYTAEAKKDPAGPTDVWTRITRGGGWHDESNDCRSANRGWARKSSLKSYDIGLRVVRVLPLEKPAM